MFVPHKKHAYGPLRRARGIASRFYFVLKRMDSFAEISLQMFLLTLALLRINLQIFIEEHRRK
jgi:hypothetical protein